MDDIVTVMIRIIVGVPFLILLLVIGAGMLACWIVATGYLWSRFYRPEPGWPRDFKTIEEYHRSRPTGSVESIRFRLAYWFYVGDEMGGHTMDITLVVLLLSGLLLFFSYLIGRGVLSCP